MSIGSIQIIAVFNGQAMRKYFRHCAFMHETAKLAHRKHRDDGPFRPSSDSWFITAGEWATDKIQSGMDWIAGMDDVIIPTVSKSKIEETAIRFESKFLELGAQDPGKAFGYWDLKKKQREVDYNKITYMIACETGHQNAMGIAAGVAGKMIVPVKLACDLFYTFVPAATGTGFLAGVGYAAATGVVSAATTRQVSDTSIAVGVNSTVAGAGALAGGPLERAGQAGMDTLKVVKEQKMTLDNLKTQRSALEGPKSSPAAYRKASTEFAELSRQVRSSQEALQNSRQLAQKTPKPSLLRAAGRSLVKGTQIIGAQFAVEDAIKSWRSFDTTVQF